MKYLVLAAAIGLASAASAQQKPFLYDFDGSFDDATFAVENAIVGHGLIVDHVSHTGDMLNRTAADVGSDKKIFEHADVFLFCSAVVSREVMEADPMNISFCPYNVFVIETDAGVQVGFQDYPDGAMQKVENLLQQIVAEAIDG